MVGIAHPTIKNNMTTLNNIITSTFGADATQDTNQYPASVPLFQILRERFAEIAKAMKTAGGRLAAEWATDERLYRNFKSQILRC